MGQCLMLGDLADRSIVSIDTSLARTIIWTCCRDALTYGGVRSGEAMRRLGRLYMACFSFNHESGSYPSAGDLRGVGRLATLS
jgi:hypothetical protein